MNTHDITELITGKLDPSRRKEVLTDINSDAANREIYQKAKITWSLMSSSKTMTDYRIEESFAKLREQIHPTRPASLFSPLTKYAAVLVLSLGLSAVMFYWGSTNPWTNSKQDKYTTVVADYGQISKVVLPDSSIVWLNAGSTLSYNNRFAENNRKLNLTGEAYFDVRENKKMAFELTSGDVSVKVLGTKFNVSAYHNEKTIDVVLESGSVEMKAANNKSTYFLKPDEKGEFDRETGSVVIKKIDSNYYTSWKDGSLVFNNTPMGEVIKKLERKFNVTIEVKNPKIYESIFNAKFKTETLEQILCFINYSCPIKYKLVHDENTRTLIATLY